MYTIFRQPPTIPRLKKYIVFFYYIEIRKKNIHIPLMYIHFFRTVIPWERNFRQLSRGT